jgi:hypothetical protein
MRIGKIFKKMLLCGTTMFIYMKNMKMNSRRSALSVAKRFFLPALGMMCGIIHCSCAVRLDLTEAEITAARTFKAPSGKGMVYVYKEK